MRTKGPRTGLNASQLNKLLGGMRGMNMPAFLFLLASAHATHWAPSMWRPQLREHLYASSPIQAEQDEWLGKGPQLPCEGTQWGFARGEFLRYPV